MAARGPTVAALLASVAGVADGVKLQEAQPSADKNYPVTRVVNLLKEMQAQLQSEADADQEVYEKLACWCETNDKAKTQAIADAETKLSQLTATIDKQTALSATVTAEIGNLEKEIAHNEKALADATAIREKQAAEFTAEEKEMLQSITGLSAAITVLSKHHGGAASAASLLDESGAQGAALEQAVEVAQAMLKHNAKALRGSVTPKQRRVVAALAKQAPYGGKGFAKYVPQSGEVFGILSEMKTTFENNLSESQKEELKAQQAYAELKVAKEEEIANGKSFLEQKKEQLAASDEALVNAKEEKEDTEASLSADQKFLMELKERCSLTDQQWEERQKARNEEMSAVAEAISILAGDQARDTFSRTFNAASFLQLQQSAISESRRKAAGILLTAAAKANNPKLSMLASSVKLDAFEKVKKAIDDMVADLLKEADDEMKHRDTCKDELAENDRDTQKQEHAKEATQMKIATLEQNIKELSSTIATLKAEVEDLNTQLKRAGEDRGLENKEFHSTVTDQRETQRLLEDAHGVLSRIYRAQAEAAAAEAGGSLLQKGKRQQPTPPEGFKDYNKQGGGNSVLMLLEHIIAEAKELEAAATHAEDKAQADYEDFVKETNNSVDTKQKAITDRGAEKSQAESDLTEAKSELDGVLSELSALAEGKAALHKSCDYFLKNFEVRSQARQEEIDALREAKAYLSGMNQ
eukprot:TRINITY_DN1449_c0_g1_i1.p1 TRINITY_DN1449_c0_g1~~TRINITY_DN1449_c0_g1_i1.p1  ORF type:complete len:724 (+),score=311.15 TRINITY_DN1449_c0_g1_i1:80-2173(+)